jgi:aspartyl-tRNA(Asn)/glutamyl-tRNA(Gln) amidotransferase subunit B
MWLGICDGNMQEGSFRCDVNVSVRKPGEPFGTRREIKNLNSFRYLVDAVNYEVNWQIDQRGRLHHPAGHVLFNPDTGETRAMRSKEDAADYRYFPDPDLPPLVIAPEWVERVKGEMPELPRAMAERFQQADGLPAYDDDDDPVAGHRPLLRGRARGLRPAQAGGQLADGRGEQAPERRGASIQDARSARPCWRS